MKGFTYIFIAVLMIYLSAGEVNAAFPAASCRPRPAQDSCVVPYRLAAAGMPRSSGYDGPGYGIFSLVGAVAAYLLLLGATLNSFDHDPGIEVFFYSILGIAALVAGIIGFNKKMRGLAIAGLILSSILVFFIILAIVLALAGA